MAEIDILKLFILGLAVFRITHLIVFDKITEFFRLFFLTEQEEENGTGVIEVYYVPRGKGIRRFVGELISCHWCTGIWVSAGLIALHHFFPKFSSFFSLVFAIAALAAIFETVIQRLNNSDY